MMHIGCKEGRMQIEKRFKLVDAVLNLGYLLNARYIGRICVPFIPVNDMENRRVNELQLLRYENLASVEEGGLHVKLSKQRVPYLLLLETPSTSILE